MKINSYEPTHAEIQHNLREMEAAINSHAPCETHDRYLCAVCALAEAERRTREFGREAVVKENFTTAARADVECVYRPDRGLPDTSITC